MRRRRYLYLSTLAGLGAIACQSQPVPPPETTPPPGKPVFLNGAGATFPSFLYLKWFAEYQKLYPEVQISYQPIGSAAGIQQFLTGTVDFAGSDVAMTDEEAAKVRQGALFVPMTAGSIAVVYNVPGVPTGLKLSRQVLPAIFLGKITRWNHPDLAALNPELTLPDLPITVIYRSDGSGTTAIFTRHLSAIDPLWQNQVGTGLTVNWPVGTGIKDNAGISAQIQQGEGVIGYVETAYAKQLKLATAALENRSSKFLLPTQNSVEKAVADVKLDVKLRGFVADPANPEAYPIVSYSWFLIYQKYEDKAKGETLRKFIQWALVEGQKYGSDLGYVPLPGPVVAQAQALMQQHTLVAST
jgi:phosphate transport system substrate-binding protein